MLPLGSIAFPLVYVAPFYLDGSNSKLPRDHPRTIKSRAIKTIATCILFSWIPTYLAITSNPNNNTNNNTTSPLDIIPLLGIRYHGILPALILPLLLTVLLFLGPLTMHFYDTNTLLPTIPHSLIALRNLFIAPFTEELCFRSGLISFLLATGTSPSKSLWYSPFLFGFAHLHHVYDLVFHQSWSWQHAIMRCMFQFGYTLVFGWYASFLLLRTGHFVPIVLVHSFCNLMGFPRFSEISSHPHSRVICIAFVSGILSFCCLLGPLTRPTLYFTSSNSNSNSDDGLYYYGFVSLFNTDE